MIKSKYITLAAVATFAACLASCSQEDFPISEADGSQPLSITVTDGGYASEILTRAAEEGYRTDFTAGDACGLYIMEGGNTVVSNLKIVATDVGGSTQWKTADGTDIYVDNAANASYYLYYPYQANVTDQVDASASDDAGFFAPLINSWKPKTDQSDYAAGYTASDLMTATGKVSGNGITFSMAHRMALAVIELPGIVYKFTDPSISAYTAQGTAEFTPDAKPCRMADGTYRYIVNPAATTPPIIGTYADGKKEFTIIPSSLNASFFKTYKIDGGSSAYTEQEYTLQMGDYFCSNADRKGWYIIPKDLTPTESDNCIGIVFHTGKYATDNSGYSQPLTAGGPKVGDTFHGYVVALTDVHNNADDRLKWENGPGDAFDQSVGASTTTDDWNGYSNCLKIHEFVAASSGKGWEMKHFPAAHACETYGNRTLDAGGNPVNGQYDWQQPFAAPGNTSGWFLPSCGQLKYLHGNGGFLSSQILKVGNNTSNTEVKNYIKWFSTIWCYISSSENAEFSDMVRGVAFYYGNMVNDDKDSPLDVRAVLAF